MVERDAYWSKMLFHIMGSLIQSLVSNVGVEKNPLSGGGTSVLLTVLIQHFLFGLIVV